MWFSICQTGQIENWLWRLWAHNHQQIWADTLRNIWFIKFSNFIESVHHIQASGPVRGCIFCIAMLSNNPVTSYQCYKKRNIRGQKFRGFLLVNLLHQLAPNPHHRLSITYGSDIFTISCWPMTDVNQNIARNPKGKWSQKELKIMM